MAYRAEKRPAFQTLEAVVLFMSLVSALLRDIIASLDVLAVVP